MKLKDFLEKALDCDLNIPVVLDNKDGSSSDIEDIIECTNEENEKIAAIKIIGD